MRNNQPVTRTEHKMKPDDVLVSRTDLKGHILYANKAFCDIAGFTFEALKGKAHNTVRHPDMPAAAFQDLWDTLKAEKPWTGFVKNRCKNGDYYWVLANVSPEYDTNGNISSYLSVRTTPTQKQINAVENLYQQINAGKASLPSTLKASWFKKIKLKTVMIMASLLSILTLIALGGFYITELLDQSKRTDLRVASVPYFGAIRNVLEVLPQHRGLGNAWYNGNKDSAIKLASLEHKIDAAMEALLKTAAQSPMTGLYDHVKAINRDWRTLKSGWKQSTAKRSFKQHSAIINQLLALSSNVFHQGDIVTDPNLGTIHLGEFMSESIPELNEFLGRMRGLGSGIAASHKISDAQRDTLLKMLVQAEHIESGLQADVGHVIHAFNPELDSTLSQPASVLESASATFFLQINDGLLHANTIKLDSQHYFEQGTHAIGASLALFDTMQKALGQLLAVEQAGVQQRLYLSMLLVGLGVLGSLLLSLLMIIKTFRPLQEIVEGMQRIVEGDYKQMPVKHAHDELGDIVDDMKTMQSILQYEIFEGKAMTQQRESEQQQAAADKAATEAQLADAFESNVGALVDGLATEVQQVNGSARTMDEISDALAAQSESAMHSVDLGSSHVNSTAAAIEEMSVTIADISRQVAGTQSISAQAVTEAEAATAMMHKLATEADEIGSVVGAISEIAEQTNLLALNASIEAARAGDAGRGFSVVAGEVKELANQTSRATDQIRQQVEGIQTESRDAMEAITKISATIGEINQFTSAVTEAMEQQAMAGREISDAAQQADMSMGEARTSVGELADSASSVDQSSDEMIEVAESMAHRSEEVQQGIRDFLVTLRQTKSTDLL
ncbi:MAG: PAS domain-containing methyl-accepting chemotaxis protein [Mariprofundus sp.]|nr:PAS domain-containing methyl-accepting chemotaxis protein [Mariprofundus sp.]